MPKTTVSPSGIRALCATILVSGTFQVAVAAEDASVGFRGRVQPLLATYCGECHGAHKQKAKLDFSAQRSAEQLGAEQETWFHVLDQVESGNMPPDDEKKQPSPQDRNLLAEWIRGDYTTMLIARQRRLGRSHLRRLSRSEYANTVQDLLGIRPTVGLDLPMDGRVGGYDKVGAALPLSASGAAGYFRMAEAELKWVLAPLPAAASPNAIVTDLDPRRSVHVAAMESGQSAGHTLVLPDRTMVSFNSDLTSGRFDFHGVSTPGMHRVRFSVYGYQTDKPLAFGIYVGHTEAYPQLVDLVGVLVAPPGKAAVVGTEVYMRTRDVNEVAPISDNIRIVPFGIGVQVPKNSQASVCKGPGLAVQWMELEEPERPLPGDRWLTADFPKPFLDELRADPRTVLPGKEGPASKCANRDGFLTLMRMTFARVGARLFRRDPSAAELTAAVGGIAAQIDAGRPLAGAFLDQVTEWMTSPDFLCVIEPPGQLSDFALASRLAYFLWDSTPDEQLLELARKGTLHAPKVLRAQTERLLNDVKGQRFIDDFSDQWLGLRAIDDTSPDAKLYPEYNDDLKRASVLETRAFFGRMVAEDLSVRMVVASPWVLVNDQLARLYGLPDVAGTELRAVMLPESSPYGGLWTQSAVMKVTANGTLTSPVKRGVWVAERLLGIPIAPPPANIKPVDPDVRGATTLRERLALHRSKGNCASCHAKFDPYGFALESFDVTGRFRTAYRTGEGNAWHDGLPVDCSGETPDGRKFSGVAQLRTLLTAHPEQLARGLARQLIAYATGEPATVVDQRAVDAIVGGLDAKFGTRALIHAVVQSELFRWK